MTSSQRNCACFTSFSPTRPPPRSTLFPYTTLFRSLFSGETEFPMTWGPCRNTFHCKEPVRPPFIPSFSLAGAHATTSFHLLHRSEEHTSELQSQSNLVCRLLLEKKNLHDDQLAAQLRVLYFFFTDTPPTQIYTLSLHDALPIFIFGGDRVPNDLGPM